MNPNLAVLDATTITAIAGAAVTIIGVLVTGVISIINALHGIAKATAAIEGHVNSEKTAAEGREITLRKENDLLRETLTDKSTTARLLAQAAVSIASKDLVTKEPMPPL